MVGGGGGGAGYGGYGTDKTQVSKRKRIMCETCYIHTYTVTLQSVWKKGIIP